MSCPPTSTTISTSNNNDNDNDDDDRLVQEVAAVLQPRRNNAEENAELRAQRIASRLVEVVAHDSDVVLATGSLEGEEPISDGPLRGLMRVALTMAPGATCRLQDLDKLMVRIGGIQVCEPLDQQTAWHVETKLEIPNKRVIFVAWPTNLFLASILGVPRGDSREGLLYPIKMDERHMEIDGLLFSIVTKRGISTDRDVINGISLCIGDDDVEMVTFDTMMFASSVGGDRIPMLKFLTGMNHLMSQEADQE